MNYRLFVRTPPFLQLACSGSYLVLSVTFALFGWRPGPDYTGFLDSLPLRILVDAVLISWTITAIQWPMAKILRKMDALSTPWIVPADMFLICIAGGYVALALIADVLPVLSVAVLASVALFVLNAAGNAYQKRG